MNFVQGFLALLAVAVGMVYAGLNLVMHWILQIGMLAGAAAIIALDVFALAVWFVNWKYYPEEN